MRHHCTACAREFFDDSGGHPRSGEVHCVFCGAKIITRPRGVPFGDVPRQSSFALGVISGSGMGFPDTLRQFRVRPAPPALDSLSPVAGAGGDERDAQPAPWRGGPFWVSLIVGVAAGVALASGFTSLPRQGSLEAAARLPALAPSVAAPPPVASVRASQAPLVSSAPSAIPSAPPKAPMKPAVTPAQERRFWLERARAHQRAYRLEDAERLYRQVLHHSSSDSEALAGLGELALLRGTTDLAATHFQRALAANRDYIPALIAVADIRWQAGRLDEARRAYQEIVQSYSADLYPPYVVQRSQGIAPPHCDEAAPPVAQP